jgi:hypothetical protein
MNGALQYSALLGAFADASQPPHWYEQVTGVIAIPAAIVALAYSYLLIRKTQLESRKLELEIGIAERTEKSAVDRQLPPTGERSVHDVHRLESIAETLANRRYFILILRSVVSG